jgi:hypothetical protein
MLAVGKRLIEAQRLEAKISKVYHKHPIPEGLEEWNNARRLVERLAEEYVRAIRVWRISIEAEMTRDSATNHKWRWH